MVCAFAEQANRDHSHVINAQKLTFSIQIHELEKLVLSQPPLHCRTASVLLLLLSYRDENVTPCSYPSSTIGPFTWLDMCSIASWFIFIMFTSLAFQFRSVAALHGRQSAGGCPTTIMNTCERRSQGWLDENILYDTCQVPYK